MFFWLRGIREPLAEIKLDEEYEKYEI